MSQTRKPQKFRNSWVSFSGSCHILQQCSSVSLGDVFMLKRILCLRVLSVLITLHLFLSSSLVPHLLSSSWHCHCKGENSRFRIPQQNKKKCSFITVSLPFYKVLARTWSATGQPHLWMPSEWCQQPSTTPSCWALWEMSYGSCQPLCEWRSC